jgi:hypothetical protein
MTDNAQDESTQNEPVMDGANDATDEEKLHGLIEQVEHDHGEEGPAAMADHLRDRVAETGAEPEEPGDVQD